MTQQHAKTHSAVIKHYQHATVF